MPRILPVFELTALASIVWVKSLCSVRVLFLHWSLLSVRVLMRHWNPLKFGVLSFSFKFVQYTALEMGLTFFLWVWDCAPVSYTVQQAAGMSQCQLRAGISVGLPVAYNTRHNRILRGMRPRYSALKMHVSWTLTEDKPGVDPPCKFRKKIKILKTERNGVCNAEDHKHCSLFRCDPLSHIMAIDEQFQIAISLNMFILNLDISRRYVYLY
jgi:hypothetical protein